MLYQSISSYYLYFLHAFQAAVAFASVISWQLQIALTNIRRQNLPRSRGVEISKAIMARTGGNYAGILTHLCCALRFLARKALVVRLILIVEFLHIVNLLPIANEQDCLQTTSKYNIDEVEFSS